VYGQGYISPTKHESHAWNQIQVEGNWYFMDSTWDLYREPYFKYFLIDKEHLLRDHTVDAHPKTEECTTMAMNLYEYQHRRIEKSTLTDLKS